jgi:hypothetical protein
VIVTNKHTVPVIAQFMAIDGSRGFNPCQQHPSSIDAPLRPDIELSRAISGRWDIKEANIRRPVTDNEMVIAEKNHAMGIT